MKSALLSRACSFPLRASFISDDERPVHEASIEVEFAARPEVLGERPQDGAQGAFADQLLESAMAGLVLGARAAGVSFQSLGSLTSCPGLIWRFLGMIIDTFPPSPST